MKMLTNVKIMEGMWEPGENSGMLAFKWELVKPGNRFMFISYMGHPRPSVKAG